MSEIETVIGEAWRGLPAGQRDVLVALAVGGPASGAEIHRRIRGDEPQTEPTTQRNLASLAEFGYVAREEGGGAFTNSLTDRGFALVERNVCDVADRVGGER